MHHPFIIRFSLLFVLQLSIFCLSVYAQKNERGVKRPKLVVGIVIDQMRYDFLYRYQDRYSEGGFKRLMYQGNTCENMHINYLPTYTGPGHACIYTGSVPALHGIASNDWIDKITGAKVYCTDDANAKAIGGTQRAGKMSPRNMLANTIGDEMRLASNFKSKVIAMSVKDRASILPGGFTSNGSYWMDDSNGVFMTSTFYTNTLPDWVQAFNAKARANTFMANGWNTLFPISTYVQSTDDQNNYEGKFAGETAPVFPHLLKGLKASDIKKTPFGNSILFEFAKAAIEAEKLGAREVCDLLAISCSSPDYIGHQFGPNSIEVEDTYLRLDKEIAAFLTYLDTKLGAGNYTCFLTADHGVAHNPQFLKDVKIPAGYFYSSNLLKELNNALSIPFKSDRLVKEVGENFIWLQHDLLDSMHVDASDVKKSIFKTLRLHPEILYAVDMENIQLSLLPEYIKQMAINGFHSTRSGEILLILNPGWFDAYSTTGTTHGVWNPYDTHIPMLWYGWGIKKGVTRRHVYMTDIAATIANLLHIQAPNASIGKCIEEVLLLK